MAGLLWIVVGAVRGTTTIYWAVRVSVRQSRQRFWCATKPAWLRRLLVGRMGLTGPKLRDTPWCYS